MGDVTKYRVIGMDCAACAAKVENAARSAGAENPKVSTASQILTLQAGGSDDRLAAVEQAVAAVGYRLDRLDPRAGDTPEAAQPHLTLAYRRALWIVIGLNIGYGVIEMAGGFLSGSQALKADALDFLGDGMITFLGLLAIGWSLAWRARSAMIQGVFLALLGGGVIVNTAFRLFTHQPVEAGLMGIVALVALAVNVAAALVLVPHRTGDANMRAVWFFSRNDAIANAAVVVAAVLVAWTGTAWPDRVVAFAIAGLFLHSAWVIIRDAAGDLADTRKRAGNKP